MKMEPSGRTSTRTTDSEWADYAQCEILDETQIERSKRSLSGAAQKTGGKKWENKKTKKNGRSEKNHALRSQHLNEPNSNAQHQQKNNRKTKP